nr:MAG: hypothetical protein [Molluscum contagiosum virus]
MGRILYCTRLTSPYFMSSKSASSRASGLLPSKRYPSTSSTISAATSSWLASTSVRSVAILATTVGMHTAKKELQCVKRRKLSCRRQNSPASCTYGA